MHLQLEVLQIWGVVGLQVHGSCNHRLVYKEVVEKYQVHVPPGLVLGSGGEGVV